VLVYSAWAGAVAFREAPGEAVEMESVAIDPLAVHGRERRGRELLLLLRPALEVEF
jgi:hypothetical protein